MVGQLSMSFKIPSPSRSGTGQAGLAQTMPTMAFVMTPEKLPVAPGSVEVKPTTLVFVTVAVVGIATALVLANGQDALTSPFWSIRAGAAHSEQ